MNLNKANQLCVCVEEKYDELIRVIRKANGAGIDVQLANGSIALNFPKGVEIHHQPHFDWSIKYGPQGFAL